MSVQPPPPLNQGATDFESDSEYIGTPVDPPSVGQPQVAGYEPLGDYYCPALPYHPSEHVAGHPAPQYRYSDPGPLGSQQTFLLQHTFYEAVPPEQCAPPDSVMPGPHWLGAVQAVANAEGNQMSSCSSDGAMAPPPESSLHIRCPPADDSSARYQPSAVQYPGYDRDATPYGENAQALPAYPISRSRQVPLFCDTNVSSPLPSSQRPHASSNSAMFAAVASYHHAYNDEGYVESPVDDSGQCELSVTSGCGHEAAATYDPQAQACQPHLDTHLPTPHAQARHTIQAFYQPPSCPYMYPVLDGPIETPGFQSDPRLIPSGVFHPHTLIHAPRPQQLHDMHNLHDSSCPSGDSQGRLSTHQVLSIPTGPLQPIPRPSSLIEDNPKKPLTLACFFCRKRKIACQSPPATSLDRTCNQCAKRKLKCVYPATSRRGVRPRVYDIQDDHLPRPSAPLSL